MNTIYPPSNISSKVIIGDNIKIGAFTEIGPDVVLQNGVTIGAYCFIPKGVILEKNCWVGPRVTFANDKYPPSHGEHWQTTIVKEGASIGAGVCILPGVTIGKNAKIGMGAVVTKDVPENEIWAGNPAKKLSKGRIYGKD